MKSYFNKKDGWTYFLQEGELHACPTNIDNSLDLENTCHVSDMMFEANAADVTKMLDEIKLQLAN